MEGQGLYRYKKTNDVYDGLWAGGLKQGAGAYEFGEDKVSPSHGANANDHDICVVLLV